MPNPGSTRRRMDSATHAQLVEDAAEAARGQFTRLVGKSKEHLSCIERFGRFPHRNALLGRDSTPEELEFMANEHQPGSGAPGKVNPAFIARRQ